MRKSERGHRHWPARKLYQAGHEPQHMNITGLDRQQILALILTFLMIGSAFFYVLAWAF